MKLLDSYLDLQKQIFDYFGYEENWKVIPIDDAREYYWLLTGEGPGDCVRYADTLEDLPIDNEGDAFKKGNFYENEIYTQRHLPKWVYYGEEYTMVCVDTQTDMNKFLQIFDNSKRITPKE